MNGERGTSIVELLVGTLLGLLALAALTAAVAVGARLVAAAGARGEAEDTAQLAVEAFTFDARRAGYDPSGAGIERVVQAGRDAVTFGADLDGDGLVDGASEEQTAYACSAANQGLSRIVGRQSMPLADGVSVCGLRYLDAAGTAFAVPPAGLGAADRARIRALALDLTLVPTALHGPTARTVLVALRSGE
ncbi:MAG: hypothetical protein E6J70_01320 [Deltaproteobacteria bacterium]|nr:MAG: hypothetical protein E6J70_01320 [Deltaproteobacteria bacterium]